MAITSQVFKRLIVFFRILVCRFQILTKMLDPTLGALVLAFPVTVATLTTRPRNAKRDKSSHVSLVILTTKAVLIAKLATMHKRKRR